MSLFDVIPIQRGLNATVSRSLEASKRYVPLKSKVQEMMAALGKDLQQIKREIKMYTYGDDMRGLISNGLHNLDYQGRLPEFTVDYEGCWRTHDDFALVLGEFYRDYLEGKHSDSEFLELGLPHLDTAIRNDVDLHIYTFSLQPTIKNELGTSWVPNIIPFENLVCEDAICLTPEEFAEKYSYGDVGFARKFMEETRKVSYRQLKKIADQCYLDYRVSEKGGDNYWGNRLAFWECVEEPRRRFSALFGIFDYFFREQLYRISRKRGLFPNYDYALSIPMDSFLKVLKNERPGI